MAIGQRAGAKRARRPLLRIPRGLALLTAQAALFMVMVRGGGQAACRAGFLCRTVTDCLELQDIGPFF